MSDQRAQQTTKSSEPRSTISQMKKTTSPEMSPDPMQSGAALQRAQAAPGTLTPSDVMALQRTIGNQAVQRMLSGNQTGPNPSPTGQTIIQPKLVVGPANDRYEQEADGIANQVMRMSASPIKSQPKRLQRKPNHSAVQRVVGPEGGSINQELESRINGSRGGGSPLPGSVRATLEPKLNADLSNVKVHTNSNAVQLNRELGAKAFTSRNHIYYGAGQSPADLALTTHEVVHTMQQGAVQPVQRQPEQAAETPQPTTQATNDTVVQRFAYDDDPSTWAPVNRIKRSGEGVEGVYFVFKGSNMLIVKPVRDPGNVEYANRMTGAITGLATPDTKSYPLTGSDPISQLLKTTPIEGARSDKELEDKLEFNSYWLVMSTVAGKSIQTLPEDATDNQALDFITNQRALQDTGRIMVADAFLGNQDRLIGQRVNLGNFFYNAADQRAATIDNDMEVEKGAFKRNGSFDMPTAMEIFEWLMDNGQRNGVINKFIAKFKQSHPGVVASMDDNQVRAWVSEGIDLGMADLQRAMQNMNLVRSVKDIDSKYGKSNKRDYAMIKGRAQYMDARVGGMSKDEAKQKMGKYIKYKEMYTKLPKGLKWTARIWNGGRGF